jgi:hypothetical protein
MPSPSIEILRVISQFNNEFDALKLLVERGANLGVVDSKVHIALDCRKPFDKASDL